jgi:hypothetical protein
MPVFSLQGCCLLAAGAVAVVALFGRPVVAVDELSPAGGAVRRTGGGH